MIDLKNTWCQATEENYNALKNIINPINFKGIREGYAKGITHYFIIYENLRTWVVNTTSQGLPNGKQIHLVNGEFQYVETKPKNNFKDYGFEADFEGEILKEIEDMYIGYYLNKKNCPISCTWWNNGLCSVGTDLEKDYKLKPIKKEWYENPDNFPCIATKDGKNFAVIDSIDYLKRVCIYQHRVDFRPATKEEVLALLVKE